MTTQQAAVNETGAQEEGKTMLDNAQLAALRACLYVPHEDDRSDPPRAQEILWTIHVGDVLWTLACDGYMALCLRGEYGAPPNDSRINPGAMLPSLQKWIAQPKPVLFTVPAEQARAWASEAPFCYHCAGTGRIKCSNCDGSGKVVREEHCEHCEHVHRCEYVCSCSNGERNCYRCSGRGKPLAGEWSSEDRAGIIGDLVVDRERAARLLALAASGEVLVSLGDHQMSKQGLVSFSGDGWVAFLCPLNREVLEPTTPRRAPRLAAAPEVR